MTTDARNLTSAVTEDYGHGVWTEIHIHPHSVEYKVTFVPTYPEGTDERHIWWKRTVPVTLRQPNKQGRKDACRQMDETAQQCVSEISRRM